MRSKISDHFTLPHPSARLVGISTAWPTMLIALIAATSMVSISRAATDEAVQDGVLQAQCRRMAEGACVCSGPSIETLMPHDDLVLLIKMREGRDLTPRQTQVLLNARQEQCAMQDSSAPSILSGLPSSP